MKIQSIKFAADSYKRNVNQQSFSGLSKNNRNSNKQNALMKENSKRSNSIKKQPAIWIVGNSILYCGDEEDNYGYGEPDWINRRREDNEAERNKKYYGYDIPGLGSGGREVDWEN